MSVILKIKRYWYEGKEYVVDNTYAKIPAGAVVQFEAEKVNLNPCSIDWLMNDKIVASGYWGYYSTTDYVDEFKNPGTYKFKVRCTF